MSKPTEKTKPNATVIEALGDSVSPGAVLSAPNWQGVVFFRPWRIVGQAVRQDSLRVLLQPRATSAEAMRDASSITVGAPYRFTLHMFPMGTAGIPSGELHGQPASVEALPELDSANGEVNRAFEYLHPELGRLQRAARATRLEGSIRVLGKETRLTIAEQFGTPPELTASRASALLSQVRPLFEKLPDAIARKMLPLANGNWLEPGTKPWSPEAFLNLLVPKHVSIDEDAREVDVRFSCGGAFTDHGIVVTVTAKSVQDVRLR